MYLKSLTLRGFKSFASATALNFEPGITCVVGPNGSGKSNVVDAIAWVMGEQGAKSLRGGKMEDVIFAGTSGRAPLGRAEVALTIDNTDGALPIDYTEVTITRTMFRNGGSEYAINGEGCRLLDVQELLSDSGIGREMHVIVGQGRLDAILHATPEERRGFIEEAAGVLKHRKRKEKALRKLDALAVNLTRLTDLTTELRRQLKPLGRQAELARRAQVIQADLRDAQLRLLADDVATLTAAMAKEEADEAALLARRNEVEAELGAARARELELEEAVAADAPAQARAQEAYVALTRQRERFAGLRSVGAERVRAAATETGADHGPAPEEYEAQAGEVRAQAEEVGAALAAHTSALTAAMAARKQAEQALQAEEAAVNAARRAAADRREGLARLRGKVAAAASRLEARGTEIGRLESAIEDARARAERAAAAQAELAERVGGLDEGEQGLDESLTAAEETLEARSEEVAGLRGVETELRQQHAALQARAEALRAGLAQRDGSAALMAAEDRLDGLLGTVAGLIRVRPGYETALGAALGAVAEAVAVDGQDAAAQALELLAAGAPGRAHLLVAGADAEPDDWPVLPAGAVYAVDVVDADDAVRPALRRVLRRTAVVADIAAAGRLVADADVVAVTRSGEVLGRGHAAGGRSETLVEVQAAVAQAEEELARLTSELDAASAAVAATAPQLAAAEAAVAVALDALHESDARMAAVAEELGALGNQVRGAQAEESRLASSLAAATSARVADETALAELEERLRAAQEAQADDVVEPDASGVAAGKVEVEAARAAEVEARLAVRTAEERHRTLNARVAELASLARSVRERRERLAAARRRREAEASAAAEVLSALAVAEPMLAEAVAAATAARQAAEDQRTARDAELRELRARMRGLSSEADKLNDSVHRDELARAQQRLRIEAAQEKALADFGVAADVLVAEYGPTVPVPPSAVPVADADDVDPGVGAEPVPYDRETQEARARKAARELAALGRVNPLALEEFAALQERQAFLTEQLEDLKKGKEDLIGLISEVDERVREVFAEAYRDVAEQFEGVFARLFPGGEGRLLLTNPEDMLTTGVEVEARPPGKRIKRLSLLSGGERSLTAVAFLVALFKARPSPFYLLDEVEAALDDVNLGRLLNILEELRATSQLLVITHQKRTMEIADALYGVTMRDGVTQVISQRLRETV